MRKIPSLKALQAFESASRLGSFVAAAEELYLTPSAVSHQIRQLEKKLGIILFHRIHRAVVLTDIGRRYAEAVAAGFGTIEAATRDVERKDKSDIITIHSVPSFAAQWLMPRLARFSAQYPDIDVRLNASVALADLASGAADIDIRYGSVLPDSGVAVVPFTRETIVVLCAPTLHGDGPPLREPADLCHQPLIHSEVNLYSWHDWSLDHGGIRLQLDRGLRFDRSFMAISAAVDGLGVALESLLLIENELSTGRLCLPFGVQGPALACHRLLYLKSKARLPKMQAFLDWLDEQLSASGMNLQG